jgi:hypothetical protein
LKSTQTFDSSAQYAWSYPQVVFIPLKFESIFSPFWGKDQSRTDKIRPQIIIYTYYEKSIKRWSDQIIKILAVREKVKLTSHISFRLCILNPEICALLAHLIILNWKMAKVSRASVFTCHIWNMREVLAHCREKWKKILLIFIFYYFLWLNNMIWAIKKIPSVTRRFRCRNLSWH